MLALILARRINITHRFYVLVVVVKAVKDRRQVLVKRQVPAYCLDKQLCCHMISAHIQSTMLWCRLLYIIVAVVLWCEVRRNDVRLSITSFWVSPAVVCVDELRRMTRLAFEHECTHCGGSAARFDMAHMTMMVCCRRRCAGKSTADGCAIVDSVLSVSCRSLCRRNTADD